MALSKEDKEEYERLQRHLESLSEESNNLAQGNFVGGERSENRDEQQDTIAKEQDRIRDQQREILERAKSNNA